MAKSENQLFKKDNSVFIKLVVVCVAMLAALSYGYTFSNSEDTLKMVRRIYDKETPSPEDEKIIDVIWETQYEHPDDTYDEIMLVCLKYKLNKRVQQLYGPSEKEKERGSYHYGSLVHVGPISSVLKDSYQKRDGRHGYVYNYCTAVAHAMVTVGPKTITVSKTETKSAKFTMNNKAGEYAKTAAVESLEEELSNIEKYRDIAVNNFVEALNSEIDSFLDRTSHSYIREQQFEDLLIKLANLVFETKESCGEITSRMITGKLITLSLKQIKDQDRESIIKGFAKDNHIEYALPKDEIEKKKL